VLKDSEVVDNTHLNLRVGDWFEVKSPLEIARTLDAEGTLDGLPFMPEMLEHCGRRYRMLRRAEKTCVEGSDSLYTNREFHNNDVVLLDQMRCSGADHDGCQRLCTMFWKLAWLRKVDEGSSKVEPVMENAEVLLRKLQTKTSPEQYFCQSTQLGKATKLNKRSTILIKAYREVRSGAVSAPDMVKMIVFPVFRKIRDELFGRPKLLGTLTRTPVGSLGLQPGDLVQVKTVEEIRATLDRKGRNRGLSCDLELKIHCGMQYRVKSRLDRMISEATGQMRKVEGTVILDGNTCLCPWTVGGCPRLEYCYWREAWLKRAEPEVRETKTYDSNEREAAALSN
jgi:hypothetical protein